MKPEAIRYFAIVLAMSAFLISCSKDERNAQPGSVETSTIAPAEGKPAPTGTDAMTQTVEVEGSRPEAEGAGMTDTEPAAAGTTATSATSTTAGTTATSGNPPPPTRRQ